MKQQQAINYFRQAKGFQRLLDLMIKKYQSLGRIGGSVKLTSLTDAEREALASLLRRDYSRQKSVTVGLEEFAKALDKTKFSGVELKEILDGFAGEDILTKAALATRYQSQKQLFWQELSARHTHANCQSWLAHIQDKGPGTRGIHRAYDQNASQLKIQLNAVLAALTNLPDSGTRVEHYERLPFFASRLTSNPHGFDLESDQGRLLLSALQFLRWRQNADYVMQSTLNSEEKTELLGHFGLIRDDLLNFVTCVGLLGFRKGQEKPMPLWQAAWDEGIVLNVPLREIIKLERFTPAPAFYHNRTIKAVFVVENSGVYSAILDYFMDREVPPLICTHGQIKLAALILLDKLVQDNTTIYYSGDFDPEGLAMAQRLLLRYGENLKLWRYGLEDYKKALSEVELDEARLNKLQSIKARELASVKEEIAQQRKAAYQEQLIKNLISDIFFGGLTP